MVSTVDPFSAETPLETAAVRSGEDLDWAAIEAFIRTEMPDDVSLTGDFGVRQFPHGAANLT